MLVVLGDVVGFFVGDLWLIICDVDDCYFVRFMQEIVEQWFVKEIEIFEWCYEDMIGLLDFKEVCLGQCCSVFLVLIWNDIE